MKHRMQGVTLMELMVVVAVVSIIASVAVPSYRGYLRRAQRADATAALLQLRQAQEKFFLQNGQYADTAQLDAAPPGGLGLSTTSEHGHYTIGLDRPTATTFTATATATGGQTEDFLCQTFTVDELGQRTAEDSGGNDSTPRCWR